MTEQEQKDLDKLKEESNKIRQTAFSAMRDALRYDAEMLKAVGHKTNEGAAISHFKYAQQQIDKLTKEYLKKYPDERGSK